MANKFYIVPNVRSKSASIKESSGIEFLCPTNTVMTGRWHKGDENGQTQYEYATLKAIDEYGNIVQAKIEVTDIRWSSELKESSGSGFQAPSNRVIVGRWHKGDENGRTKYATAVVKADGVIAQATNEITSASFKESSGTWFITDSRRVIVGRVHKGDENGKTFYISAELIIDSSIKEPAPEGTMIVPYFRNTSETFKESNSDFICPPNMVMTGRSHTGDENGPTIYQYASLKAINAKGEMIMGTITVEDIKWEEVQKESSGLGFDAEVNRVIVGRKHFNDENAPTQYATGIVKFNGYPTYISQYTVSEAQKETSGWFYSGDKQVITARHHYGDENGYTYYGLGTIYCQKQLPANKLPFDVVVSLEQKEEDFPMVPSDFIILSRFRHHIPNGNDSGYDKNKKQFVFGNDQSSNFYNIPLDVINDRYSREKHKRLFNLRPHDSMSLNNDGYFIQPFDNLRGDTKPNGKVPVYVHILEYLNVYGIKETYVDIWLFFGYNRVELLAHQGDWEHLMVKVIDNKIQGAWLSQHTSFGFHQVPMRYRSSNELEISNVNGREQLTIYCARGTHALYSTYGDHVHLDILGVPVGIDHTTRSGYKWKVTDFMETLSIQPWKLFAGAWGEVGNSADSTGPLGPWYKRFNFWYENKIILSNIINSSEIIIVPDTYYISEELMESDGLSFVAPDNMVMVGRRHSGDENGVTTCLYASLKAINSSGTKVSGEIKVIDTSWSEWIKESSSNFIAPNGYVIVGRQHLGDENGNTRYKIGRITFNGKNTSIENTQSMVEYQLYMESKGIFFQTEPYFLYVGRVHQGDENGLTYNIQGLVKVK